MAIVGCTTQGMVEKLQKAGQPLVTSMGEYPLTVPGTLIIQNLKTGKRFDVRVFNVIGDQIVVDAQFDDGGTTPRTTNKEFSIDNGGVMLKVVIIGDFLIRFAYTNRSTYTLRDVRLMPNVWMF